MSERADIAAPALPVEFLTTLEVSVRLRWSPRTMRARVASGFFRSGIEFVTPGGGQPRWIWSRVVARVLGESPPTAPSTATSPIRIRRGVLL